MKVQIRPIRSPDDHAAAVSAIQALWDATPGTEEGDTLDVLITLVDAYEAEQMNLDRLDPIDAIKAHMDLGGRTQSDLAQLFGSRSRASEVLNRRRPLTLQQVQDLVDVWKIPAHLLIGRYATDVAA